ncbi:MAG: hypothetical protein MJA28_03855 [Gammaproteobacteria bacterium]|nr:hypothetical protein [Gammaproteobacteria bacterium]
MVNNKMSCDHNDLAVVIHSRCLMARENNPLNQTSVIGGVALPLVLPSTVLGFYLLMGLIALTYLIFSLKKQVWNALPLCSRGW